MKHTALPWHMELENYEDGIDIMLYNKHNNDLATLHSGYYFTLEEAKANAEFIVRACNCHEELLEACKLAVSCMAGYEELLVWRTQIKQALANATK